MAERRMFTKKITESDAFLDMPMSAQCLYFHLNMAADDDGFVNSPKRIQRLVGANDDDMKLLIAKSFIIVFESGIIVIKHWKMHNYIQSDRYKPTDYIDEKSMLSIKKNKAYTLEKTDMDTNCIQNVSVGKDRLGKDRLGKDNIKESKKMRFYEDNEKLDSAFADFVAMRNKIKKPMTKNAISRAKGKLLKLSNGNEELMIEILNQSVDHCWQDLYELKNKGVSNNGKSNNNTTKQFTDEELDRFADLV